ncbi:MAG: lipopolysaccharide biosynthesis protein, partial [Sphingomonadaceae bacterium]
MLKSTLSRMNQRLEAATYGRFFRDIGIVSVVRLSGGLLLFISQIFLARWMTTEAFGIYSFAWTWVAVLGSLAGLGLAATSVRFLAGYRALGDHDHMRGLVRHAWRATMGVSFLIAVAAWLMFELALPDSPYLPALRVAMLAVPVMAALNIDAAFARGMQWMSVASLAEQIGRPALLLLFGVILVEALGIRGAVPFVAACLAAYFLVTFVQHIVVHRRLASALGGGARRYDGVQWRKVSTMLLLLNGAQMLRMNGDPILVGALLGPEELGIYIAAVRTATLVSFVMTITSVVAQPNLSAIHARQDGQEL